MKLVSLGTLAAMAVLEPKSNCEGSRFVGCPADRDGCACNDACEVRDDRLASSSVDEGGRRRNGAVQAMGYAWMRSYLGRCGFLRRRGPISHMDKQLLTLSLRVLVSARARKLASLSYWPR